MAGFLPYSQARAALAAQRPRQRPWSPPIVDPRSTAAGRDIEAFLAHASHGWVAEQADDQHGVTEDDLFSRHRTLFRERREPSSDHNYGYDYTYNRARNQRREASDVSVEALDLADYAMTLRRQGPEWDPYPSHDYPTSTVRRPFSRETPPTTTATTMSPGRRRREAELSPPRNPPPSSYPHERIFSPTYAPQPSALPPLDRPFSALSRDTTRPPPSLISAGATSYSSHVESSYPPAPSSSQSPPHRPESLRRPHSLPVDFLPPRWPTIFTPPPVPPNPHQTTHHAPPVDLQSVDADINTFPPWARGWYNTRDTTTPPARKDIASPVYSAESGFYTHPSTPGPQRDFLPWSSLNTGNAEEGRVSEEVKVERLRMLEREFGDANNAKHGRDQNEWPVGMVGSVDERGRLITAGPKKRVAVRVLQGLFACGTAVSGIYGALFIKSPDPPPAAGKPPAFVLYILSAVTFLAIIYMYGLRPCLGRRKRAKQTNTTNPTGMMVLPVTNTMQAKKKKGKKGHKKGGAGEGGSVQVNLIVDPTMFGTKRGNNTLPGRYDTDEDEDEDGPLPADGTSRRRQGPPRRSFFQSMAMEEQWKYARSELKILTAFDAIMMVLWFATFVFVLMGQRCPNDTRYNGWCAAYNWATAGACLLAVTLLISICFDVKDLRDSKVSPRTRTRT